MRRLIARAVFVVTIAFAWSVSAHAQVSGDVSVRIFSTQNLDALTLTPLNANVTIRRCAACPTVLMALPVKVVHAGSNITVDGTPTAAFDIAGELRVTEGKSHPVSAAGKWRFDVAHGEMRVVVTIPRERYVAAVLASESAPDDAPGALRALAVVVRSFAFAETGRHRVDGFDFCDSTHCQAMRLGPVPARIDDAVRATTGETLWMGGSRVAAYFTQHCGGTTEDAAVLWGGAKRPWLASHTDLYCQRIPSRWHAEVSADDLRTALGREGWAMRGKPNAVHITQHTVSGRAATVEVVASGGEHVSLPASGFRFAVDRALGWNQLRSDWYTLSFHGEKAVFEGRGYGHGVGLCQAGAHAMAAEAHGDPAQTERDILRFYFPGTVVRIAAADEGWKQREGAGWTLISATPDDATVRIGDAAWARAQALFPTATKQRPVVRVLPDTGLFRQFTSEPGWALGASRGASIAVQPPGVVARHEKVEDLLLHEFLHVLVESEAQSSTPLWLREGLVEALSTQQPGNMRVGNARGGMKPPEIDAALLRANTWEQAYEAHRAASALVSALVERYGLGAVRGWLRSGVPAAVLAR